MELESFDTEPGYHLSCSCSLFVCNEPIVSVQFLYPYSQSNEEFYLVNELILLEIVCNGDFSFILVQFEGTLMNYLISCVIGILHGYQKLKVNVM